MRPMTAGAIVFCTTIVLSLTVLFLFEVDRLEKKIRVLEKRQPIVIKIFPQTMSESPRLIKGLLPSVRDIDFGSYSEEQISRIIYGRDKNESLVSSARVP